MNEIPRITVLADNSVHRQKMLGEHGFAALVEYAGRQALLDTGQGHALFHNAALLNLSLENLDAIVLSHGHFDHTGALAPLMDIASHASVYLHPRATEPKYARSPQPPHRYIGMPQSAREALQQHAARIHFVRAPIEIFPGLWCTGEIPRNDNRDSSEGRFFLDPECTQPDPILDDQALFVATAKSLWVVTGCAHAGVVNTLDYIRHLAPKREVKALLGGFHLLNSGRTRWRQVLADLQERNVQHFGPCHCTGTGAIAYLREWCPDRFWEVGAGWVSPTRA